MVKRLRAGRFPCAAQGSVRSRWRIRPVARRRTSGEAVVAVAGAEAKGALSVHMDFAALRRQASWWRFPQRTPNLSWKATIVPSPTSARCAEHDSDTDNTRIAVEKIHWRWRERKPTEAVQRVAIALFCLRLSLAHAPAKGTDKGNVEGLVGYARRNFMVPVPRVASWDVLNQHLLEQCLQRRGKKVHGEKETIAERLKRDQEKLLPLPATPHEACDKRTTRASSQALVRYETNDYSVPVAYGHRQVLVKAFVWEVVISVASEVIARHGRSYQREEMIFNPLHYLALLEQKTNALDQAAPLQNWPLPEEFDELRRMDGKPGSCETRARASSCRCCDCWKHFPRGRSDGWAVQQALSASRHRLRCGETSAGPVRHRATSAEAGSGELIRTSARGGSSPDSRRRLPGSVGGVL